MLSDKNRIRKNTDFKRAYQYGDLFFSHYFVLHSLKRDDQKSTRLGIVPSRKIKKAVLRNRLKRRIREIFKQYSKNIKRSYDLVINTRSEAVNASYEDLKKDFEYLIKKSQLEIDPASDDDRLVGS
ncbi:MAG TPA: ribonuclease P protein component [Syntrophomonadaceae bacterium]|nr:ribonuclease P protein component [Syntrophomonadaceae bacterium]